MMSSTPLNTKTGLPVPNATLPFWRTELHELDSFRTSESLPSECDILVIGAGYAGVSTLYHLLDSSNGPDPSKIVLVEAREACSGASGRNGGHIKPDVYYNILKYTKKYGAENAAAFARFENANIYAVKEMVEKENIECDFVLTRAVDVYLDEAHAKISHDSYQELRRIGVADLGDVQYLEASKAEAISGVKGAKCCFSFAAAHLWPYKLIMHLLSKLVAKGINLQTHTPVTSISSTPDAAGRWTVTTSRGSIRASKIIFATNGYTAAIAPQFEQKIIPVRGICSRIVPVVPKKTSHLVNTYSLRYGPALYDYMIPRLDRSIVIGGAKDRFWHDKSHWYGVTDDSKLIEPAQDYFDGLMQRHFDGWEESGACTDSVWTGIMGWSSDFMPFVGEVPGKNGQFITAGFSGHGMPLIYLATKALSEMVKGEKTFEETDLPAVFKPTQERLDSKKNEILGI
ncbi:Gamma-glutamylputrescine oxidoreductase [Cytospora mali]|uniref:Gamma-glutamylputrescine oxidoreductase n=1 Tax=Cytospora mali TaxID=578113 RepID=A0A194W8Q8_CYTMA|nr:Gamma-glutamylputrescine oxidoreductase [Valsa mali]